MKVPGITIPDVPEAGKIDGDEMLLVLENNELRLKTVDRTAVHATVNSNGTITTKIASVNYGFSAATPKTQLTTLLLGNSIANQSKWSTSYWQTHSEMSLANMLCGSPMRFKRVTATTRMDAYCAYGYSGKRLPEILADLEGQVFATLRTAAIVPELVVGMALLENDIASGATTDSMISSLTQFLRDIKGRFPGAIIMLCTPRVSFSYNTAAAVLAYQTIRDYMLALDDGYSIFTARVDGYENPLSLGTPLGTSGAPIYTDGSVHPNARGALINARAIAKCLKRLSTVWQTGYQANSTNMALGGTGAASGTNVSGTVPTSTAVSGSAAATSFVCTAEQPGLLMTITVPVDAGPNPLDISSLNFGSLAVTGTEVSPFIEVELVSGAENLHGIEIMARDTGTATWFYLIRNQANDKLPDWLNGDILTQVIPPLPVSAFTSGACTVYIRPLMKYTGGACTFRVRSQGVGLVS